jgi:hypothetical protein
MNIGLVLSPDAAEAVGGPTGPGFSACRLEFDINSDFAWKQPFSTDSIELANQGDVP